MSDWFSTLVAGRELPIDAASQLHERGFVVLPGPVPSDRVEQLADAYSAAVASAVVADIRIGSTSTRVSDFVNRGPEFDPLYIFPPLLEACCLVIGRPFKLEFLPRADGAAVHARPEPARRRAQRLRRLAACRFHSDGGCVPAGQRCHPVRAGLAAVAGPASGQRFRSAGRECWAGAGLRPCGLTPRLQWVHMAWPRRKPINGSTPIAPGRVRSERRARGDRLLGRHATRDARAARPTGAAGAGTLTGSRVATTPFDFSLTVM
jgi:hypothetical protein